MAGSLPAPLLQLGLFAKENNPYLCPRAAQQWDAGQETRDTHVPWAAVGGKDLGGREGPGWVRRTWVGGKDPGPAQGWWVMGDSSALDLHVLCLGLLWGPGRRPKVGEGKEDLYKSFRAQFLLL